MRRFDDLETPAPSAESHSVAAIRHFTAYVRHIEAGELVRAAGRLRLAMREVHRIDLNRRREST